MHRQHSQSRQAPHAPPDQQSGWTAYTVRVITPTILHSRLQRRMCRPPPLPLIPTRSLTQPHTQTCLARTSRRQHHRLREAAEPSRSPTSSRRPALRSCGKSSACPQSNTPAPSTGRTLACESLGSQRHHVTGSHTDRRGRHSTVHTLAAACAATSVGFHRLPPPPPGAASPPHSLIGALLIQQPAGASRPANRLPPNRHGTIRDSRGLRE